MPHPLQVVTWTATQSFQLEVTAHVGDAGHSIRIPSLRFLGLPARKLWLIFDHGVKRPWPLTFDFSTSKWGHPASSANFQLAMPFHTRLKVKHGTHTQTDRQTDSETDRQRPTCIMRTGHNKKTFRQRTKNDYSEFKDGDADATCCSAACESNEVSAAYVTGEQWCAHLQRTDHTRCTVFTACSAQPVNVLQLYIQEYRHDALVITASEYRYRTTGTV